MSQAAQWRIAAYRGLFEGDSGEVGLLLPACPAHIEAEGFPQVGTVLAEPHHTVVQVKEAPDDITLRKGLTAQRASDTHTNP